MWLFYLVFIIYTYEASCMYYSRMIERTRTMHKPIYLVHTINVMLLHE
jgi:hypothetical protein